MGIAPYKTFTFGGVSSSAYDVYLTGEGVFNAPERAVEILEIHGRNGAFALDLGRFENVEVTYKAGIYDLNEANFATKVANLRNWLCSHIGYVRLEDDYNTGEYRMAVYKSGLEVEHEGLINGEFDIVFDCKPQRWLTSGETATAVANNGTLTNPTLFDAEPLLEVKGYGGIEFNGYEIDVENAVLGDITIADGDAFTGVSKTYEFDAGLFTVGDDIKVDGSLSFTAKVVVTGGDGISIPGETVTDTNSDFETTMEAFNVILTNRAEANGTTSFTASFDVGTNKTVTNTMTLSATGNVSPVGPFTCTFTRVQTITYDASASTITVSVTYSATSSKPAVSAQNIRSAGKVTIIGDSTVSALGNPTYIDCEIGEAYMIKNSNIVSCNQAVALGSDLPKLAPGTNTFTYDNTITELKVTPRWWQV